MKKYVNFLSNKTLHLFNMLLQHIEPMFAPRSYSPEYAPVFIVGAPRSGSTLFYQVLVNRFGFGYFNNLHRKYFGFPYFLQLLIGKWKPKDFVASYRSLHGTTQGIWEPSENGAFWYRWFPRKPQYVSLENVDQNKLRQMKRVVAGMITAFDAPILFKNMNCALRLRPLAASFPDAVFLVIQREPLLMAQSILETRQRVYGDIRKWWSMEPPKFPDIQKLEPEEQVVLQIREIYDLINCDSQAIGRERFLFVQYEDFCADVHQTMDQVYKFLKERGIKLEVRGDVPASFYASKDIRLDQPTVNRLVQALKKR